MVLQRLLRARRWLVPAVLALALAACGNVPASNPDPIPEPDASVPVDPPPPPPKPGSTRGGVAAARGVVRNGTLTLQVELGFVAGARTSNGKTALDVGAAASE